MPSDFKPHDEDRERVTGAIETLRSLTPFTIVEPKVTDYCLRVSDLKRDIVSMACILLEQDTETRRFAEVLGNSSSTMEDRLLVFVNHTDELFEAIDRLASSYKALFFFIRAIQDTTYAALLEMLGQRAGKGTSMAYCFKPSKNGRISNNPARQLILFQLPGYEEWFGSFRDLRNTLKLGRGHGMHTGNGRIELVISLQGESQSKIEAQVGLTSVATALAMTTALISLLNSSSRKDLAET